MYDVCMYHDRPDPSSCFSRERCDSRLQAMCPLFLHTRDAGRKACSRPLKTIDHIINGTPRDIPGWLVVAAGYCFSTAPLLTAHDCLNGCCGIETFTARWWLGGGVKSLPFFLSQVLLRLPRAWCVVAVADVSIGVWAFSRASRPGWRLEVRYSVLVECYISAEIVCRYDGVVE